MVNEVAHSDAQRYAGGMVMFRAPGALAFVSKPFCALALLCGAPDCGHEEPPTPALSASVASPEGPDAPASPAASRSSPPAPAVPAATSVTPSASASAPADASASRVDSSLLPQTRDRPQASGDAFEARVTALWDAIVRDDPDRAMPFFFPLGAYQQVKDVGDPASDWRHRLVAAYRRDIHALHGRLDVTADGKLLGFEVPESRGRWVEPGEEWNKIGYYRVFGSRLRYRDGTGEHAFDVKSLISWRGEWFVVHLGAI